MFSVYFIQARLFLLCFAIGNISITNQKKKENTLNQAYLDTSINHTTYHGLLGEILNKHVWSIFNLLGFSVYTNT